MKELKQLAELIASSNFDETEGLVESLLNFLDHTPADGIGMKFGNLIREALDNPDERGK